MRILYLARRPFSEMQAEGIRARRGRVVLGLLSHDQVDSLTYVWVQEERNPTQDSCATQFSAKLRLAPLYRLALPLAGTLAPLRAWDRRNKQKQLAA